MFDSNLAVTEAFGLSEPANDAAYEGGAVIRSCEDRFCDDVLAATVRGGRDPSHRRRSILTRFEDDTARLFRPFRVY